MRALLMGAALTGFVAGTTVASSAQAGDAKDTGKKVAKEKVEKHCCKGQNSCKGKGGCGADKGKNDCKGKGGCSTQKAGCAGKGPCKEKETKS